MYSKNVVTLVIQSYALTTSSSCNSKKSPLIGNAANMNGILERYPKETIIQNVMAADREDLSVNNNQSWKWPTA